MTHSEQIHPEIVVGLVATPPDYPARVAARPTAELAGHLTEWVDADVRWTVREGWGEVAPRRDGGVEALLDDLASRRAYGRWDVAICLTDLPLQAPASLPRPVARAVRGRTLRLIDAGRCGRPVTPAGAGRLRVVRRGPWVQATQQCRWTPGSARSAPEPGGVAR